LPADRLRALESINARALAKFVQELVPKLEAETLVMGNFTEADTIELAKAMALRLKPTANCDGSVLPKHPALPVSVVPIERATIWVEDSPDKGNRNIAVELYWQLGAARDLRMSMVLRLTEALMEEPLFDSLRTKQQLGYVASCGMRTTNLVHGLSIWLMSSKATPAEICRRVETFLIDFRKQVQDMPANEFERYVSSVAAQKLEPHKALASVQEAAWEELQERRYLFDRPLREATALSSVRREDILEMLDRSILFGASERRLLICAAVGGKAKTTRQNELDELQRDYSCCRIVTSQAEFLESAQMFESFV